MNILKNNTSPDILDCIADLSNDEMNVCLEDSKIQDEILEQRIEAQKKYKLSLLLQLSSMEKNTQRK